MELIGLWSVLFFVKSWGLKDLHVLGDSQVIINWALGKAQVMSLELNHWLVDTRRMMKEFNSLTFHHIYREWTVEADVLSKLVLGDMDGRILYSVFSVGSCDHKDALIFYR